MGVVVGSLAGLIGCDSPIGPQAVPENATAALLQPTSTRVTTEAEGDPCAYSFGPQIAPSAAGGTYTVDLTASCFWTAASDQPWLTTTSRPSNWSGNDKITYTLAANPAGSARTGRITVSDGSSTTQLVVSQPGVTACSVSVSPSAVTAQAAGASGQSTVTVPGGSCSWSAQSNSPWILITSGFSGTTTGTITYEVAANSGGQRFGRIIVSHPGGSTDIGFTQASACTLSVSPTAVTLPGDGGSGQSTVTVSGSGCSWSAQSNQPWITITSGSSGTASGTITYTVAANSGAQRFGRIIVTYAGGTIDIGFTQAAGCTLSISPDAVTFHYYGGSGQSTVTATGTSCSWSAQANQPWITITSGSSGTTSGTIAYTIPSYISSVQRVGSIIVTYPGGTADITITQLDFGSGFQGRTRSFPPGDRER